MLNGRAICLGVLCILFIPSAVFAQTDTIIEKIFESETRVREHVNQEVKGIETKISAVETKVDNLSTKVGTLSEDVRENKTNIGNMKEDISDLKGAVDRIWYVTLVTLISIVGFFLRSWWQNRGKADNVDAVDRLAAQTADQIGKLTEAQTKILERILAQAETQAETSAQITKLISTQAEISATRNVPGHPEVPRVEEVDELIDDKQSTPHDATGIV